MFSMSKATDLNQLVLGRQLYRTFPFSKGSLVLQYVQDMSYNLWGQNYIKWQNLYKHLSYRINTDLDSLEF